MNRFELEAENINKQETQVNMEASEKKGLRELRQSMINEAEEETSRFKKECAYDLVQLKTRCKKDGLSINAADEQELVKLSDDAEEAKRRFASETSDFITDGKIPIEKALITEISRDTNFEDSIIVKTMDPNGRVIGYAIRKNRHGDLIGNEIRYIAQGLHPMSIGAVYQLHEDDFSKLAQNGILEAYENALRKEMGFAHEDMDNLSQVKMEEKEIEPKKITEELLENDNENKELNKDEMQVEKKKDDPIMKGMEEFITSQKERSPIAETFKDITSFSNESISEFAKKSLGWAKQIFKITKKIPQKFEPGVKYNQLREHLNWHKEISRPVMEEARKKRDDLLEARGLLSMPKEEFMAFFSSKDFEVHANLKQQNVGDCYAVAAIHAMSQSPHFEMICRSSMKRLSDGSWQVKIPLLNEDGRIIIITPEEILPQKNRQFLKRKEDKGIDLRMRLMPVKGKEGLQVLEAAFIKAKFGSVDRLASEGGWGDDVLMAFGGDNFRRERIDSANWHYEKKKWEYPGLISLGEEDMANLDHFLENFDPEIHIATTSTKHDIGINVGGPRMYRVKESLNFLVAGHAYSISSIDSKNKIVNLSNPWDTSRPIKLTFDQYKENFSSFRAIRIDSHRILRNMQTLQERAA